MARTIAQMRFEVTARVGTVKVPYDVQVQIIQDGHQVYLSVIQGNDLPEGRVPLAPALRSLD